MKQPLITIVGFALVIAVLPLTATNYLLRLTTIGFKYIALASSWNIVGGFTGYPSFATAAFFGVGAYASAIPRASGSVPLPSWRTKQSARVFAITPGPR
jgi:branched-chain amino acid transport system permease protein